MDGAGDSSTVRRILLGTVLRKLREAGSVSMKEAGYHIRGTESKISRMETGKVSFKERDVADLLTLYGVTEAKEREQILNLVNEANTLGWWHTYSESLPNWFEAFVGLETAASIVRTYEVQYIPGLLQCPEYVRSVVRANRSLSQDEVERRVEVRVRRQDVLNRPGAPVFWAVLDEAALRRPMGGVESMVPQIEYLIEKADQPNITIQLLPFSVGAHAAEGGAFAMLRFAEQELPDVVYLEHLTGAQYLDRPEDVEQYARVMDRISVDALTPEDTLHALKQFKMLSARRSR
ncbi:helix-turn-helix domain-containing protein [Actinospica sp. MGRD01-02]|uniref:Helix-turn-helix domain-containing protein n=1 Tax=Actinospica acidithermotolerans TaxID=2828514 RepID=A0A941IL36_9ACTN|nr:helix-turn-helix transcriptional regulator [Actinospica acidithermotolerans]MBR7829587.1 helix-turn-helix domain-containing protein [Actinospica acidithermotolerans]